MESSYGDLPGMEGAAKLQDARAEKGEKRVALRDISKESNVLRDTPRLVGAKGENANATRSIARLKKGVSVSHCDSGSSRNSSFISATIKPSVIVSSDASSLPQNSVPKPAFVACLAPCTTLKSPNFSVDSVSSMSTCNSIRSPEFEYIDNRDSLAMTLESRENENRSISENVAIEESKLKSNGSMLMGADIVDVDTNNDPQFCSALACDIYQNLRNAETKKRPSIDFMETIQKDINANMRSILIEWLVEIAEEYRMVPDTLYLTVNYIDRYLSGNEINRQELQLLGAACMLIAAKYEEACAPEGEDLCYMTDNTYSIDELLQMEFKVLTYLKFEMTVPTAKCFLRRFVRAAQGSDELPTLQLEFLASYVAELSLLEYSMLRYAPSLVAASAVFLARFILQPTKTPWNATLSHYTLYKPSELSDCIKALHGLLCTSAGNGLPAIREKYSQHKYKFVAKKYCPASIPSEFFQDNTKVWKCDLQQRFSPVILQKLEIRLPCFIRILKPNRVSASNSGLLRGKDSNLQRAMAQKGEESYRDVEKGPQDTHSSGGDQHGFGFSDAEGHSWPSPNGAKCGSSARGGCRLSSASGSEIDGLREPCRKSCVSGLETSLDDDPEAKEDVDKGERDCRICHLSLEKAAPESGVAIVLGCSCKDDLGAAHKQCAETWFKIKGNKTCEICGSTAQNVNGVSETEVAEQLTEASSSTPQTTLPLETQGFWQGHRFLKFLLACLVLTFVVSWLFHFNMPG
ncbi:hypothetical protein ZIOFF_006801 [Zingiber officinale]|uniref:RING-CH-type domain-containing protein n=3 Tax=Zingiber officinale TaxID=94328 RepID=A0A8J5I311_ZINOF|nr:hypothetical protein ZIOFF_006801 [Zingiber officinale]